MWDDEDNNPYAGFSRRDSTEHGGHPSPNVGFGRPQTPPSGQSSPLDGDRPEFISQQHDLSDVDYDEDHEGNQGRSIGPKKGGYQSRVEQILYEHPDLEIRITKADKNQEGGGNFITYLIVTGDLSVRRRYSDFASLRQALVNLHPTLIIPPIPEKHTMADYAAKPTKAKEDKGIIDLRQRMLAVFLNRCKRMKKVREDGVWWRFLDPNASWSEVLHSYPIANIPKNVLKAPPLDTANPSTGHNYLPVPSSNAKLKSAMGTSASGTPTSPPTTAAALPSAASHTIPGPQLFRFPPSSNQLSETELDPYFITFEASSRELEQLLQGSMEKVNRRVLSHYGNLYEDMMDLGARFNAFSLSEQSQSLAIAIEKVGQAVDNTYIHTRDFSHDLSTTFAEPMRESAQFAGVVRSVLRYRVLKRVQEEMTKDELERKRNLLDSLERSELEAKRIEQYLSNTGASTSPPKRTTSSASSRSSSDRPRRDEDIESIDSDFPPTHGDAYSPPSASQGLPQSEEQQHQRKQSGGNFVTNKIFGRLTHAVHGIVDVDPERTRRDQIGKTKESLGQLEQALVVAEQDVKDASRGVLDDLKRFQGEKEDDLKRYMIAFAKCHIEWARKNKAAWEDAKSEVQNVRPGEDEQ